MSTIVVVEKNGNAVIAADTLEGSGRVNRPAKFIKNPGKIVKAGETYIGLVGWGAQYVVMEDIVNRPDIPLDFSSRSAIFKTMLKLHPVLKEEYFLMTEEKDEDEEQPYESSQFSMLVANSTGIYEVESWREATQLSGFWAKGSGRAFALGAMNAVYDLLDDPEEIAKAGLVAASLFDESTDFPMDSYNIVLNKAD
jgi:ATP-dependent protease HslVU (ClpYQ) peptidase subunit